MACEMWVLNTPVSMMPPLAPVDIARLEARSKEAPKSRFGELEFVRMSDFHCIPRELFEQAKEMDAATIDRVYKFGPLIAKSPLTLLYVLVDEVHKIKGVLWGNIDVIEAIIFIRFLSVDKEYQSPSSIILERVKNFLFNLKLGSELKKEIHFFTSIKGVPSDYKKMGAKRSKRILLEMTNGTEITEPVTED